MTKKLKFRRPLSGGRVVGLNLHEFLPIGAEVAASPTVVSSNPALCTVGPVVVGPTKRSVEWQANATGAGEGQVEFRVTWADTKGEYGETHCILQDIVTCLEQ